jgi:hypothetical protein
VTGSDDKLSPTWLVTRVTRVNHKLASMGSVITRTQGKHRVLGRYQLLDTGSGETRYLSWSEVVNLAHELGLLRTSDQNVLSSNRS